MRHDTEKATESTQADYYYYKRILFANVVLLKAVNSDSLYEMFWERTVEVSMGFNELLHMTDNVSQGNNN